MTFSKSVRAENIFVGIGKVRLSVVFMHFWNLVTCSIFFLSFVLHVLFEALRLFLSFPTSFANSSSFELKLIYNIVCIKPAWKIFWVRFVYLCHTALACHSAGCWYCYGYEWDVCKFWLVQGCAVRNAEVWRAWISCIGTTVIVCIYIEL